ncbi:two-component system response regulator [Rhodococcus sp. Leaf7]|uniref:response regulator transcription factor n=1 Tax=unclassified Rhodococcus (in: high G+C Gram-positive bacteria) TaxID=192944 RepID=UPI0006FEBFA1|nr:MULTISPECIES: response regulator transcription factor [unclassified Rhodococcus (in: high G+C Gram-positive bacteria)]KQU01935.1 two-component system response regulator [Rhodococcus sp. Leaf7]KQU38228.1 two-component system response regulator [Rhodococcus sp. Leaf247]
MRVLLVEDDPSISDPLTAGLRRYGYEVQQVTTGADALAAPLPDVVLLDLGLPDMDGLDVCREIRRSSAVPIVVITARDDEIDTVAGLEVGADDYVSKPFGVREIIARIRAVMRRTGSDSVTSVAAPQSLGPILLDRAARRVSVDGVEILLAPKEFDLLAHLAESPGAVFTREQLMEAVWDEHWFGPTRTLDVHVAALRQKFGDALALTTVRGVGFRLEV